MDKKGIAVLTMLALIGVGMAFTFVGLVVSGTSHEDVWTYQQPVKLVEGVSTDAVEICVGEECK